MDTVITIWCEWDIGEEGFAYSSEAIARKHLETNENLKEVLNDSGDTLDDLFDQGLVGFKTVRLISE